MVKYDDMPDEAQGDASEAVAEFLRDNDYENLGDACNDLGLSMQEVWDKIMADGALPECEAPSFIQVSE